MTSTETEYHTPMQPGPTSEATTSKETEYITTTETPETSSEYTTSTKVESLTTMRQETTSETMTLTDLESTTQTQQEPTTATEEAEFQTTIEIGTTLEAKAATFSTTKYDTASVLTTSPTEFPTEITSIEKTSKRTSLTIQTNEPSPGQTVFAEEPTTMTSMAATSTDTSSVAATIVSQTSETSANGTLETVNSTADTTEASLVTKASIDSTSKILSSFISTRIITHTTKANDNCSMYSCLPNGCNCTPFNFSDPAVIDLVNEKIASIKQSLLIDKKNLTTYKMRKKSADDDRVSSVFTGAVGVLVLVTLVLIIVAADIATFLGLIGRK